jgi:hypothetical protein
LRRGIKPDFANKSINHWIRRFNHAKKNMIGYLICETSDFQHIHQPYITFDMTVRASRQFACTGNNLIQACIYFAVRLCIESTWLNDRDQFLYPNDGYTTDIEFQHNCLAFTLFHGQNRISSQHGVNHWIPFTGKEVDAQEKFGSNFMSAFLNCKTFSAEAQAVLDAGRELWKYYHAKIKGNKTASVNASFYDIRDFFQGRSGKGAMKAKSDDKIYNRLIGALREKLGALTKKIQPKVYEYGFLKE